MDKYTIKDSGSDRQWIKTGRDSYDMMNRVQMIEVIAATGNGPSSERKFIADFRLELVPREESKKVRDDYLNVSGVRTSRDEALDYFAFLMMQAANLFEAIEDDDPSRDELVRILKARGEAEDGPMIVAALAYFDAAKRVHDDMKSED